jgi:hypothetical protein
MKRKVWMWVDEGMKPREITNHIYTKRQREVVGG